MKADAFNLGRSTVPDAARRWRPADEDSAVSLRRRGIVTSAGELPQRLLWALEVVPPAPSLKYRVVGASNHHSVVRSQARIQNVS